MYGNMWCFSARCSTNCCDVWLSLSKHDNIRNTNGHEGYFSFQPFRIDKVHFEIVMPFFFVPFFFCFVSCISGVFDVRLLQMNEHWTKAGRFSRCFFFLSLFSLLLISFTRTCRFKALMSLWTAFLPRPVLPLYVCLRTLLFFFQFFFLDLFYFFINNSFCQVFWNLFKKKLFLFHLVTRLRHKSEVGSDTKAYTPNDTKANEIWPKSNPIDRPKDLG